MMPFQYHSPTSKSEITELLRDGDDGTAILGGGTMLIPEMTHRRRTPGRLIDLSRAGLSGVVSIGEEIHVGAMTPYAELLKSAEVKDELPLLHEMASGITGGPQIRNKGTIGGSASYANPSSDVPVALTVMAGVMLHLDSCAGRRTVSAADFFLGAHKTIRRPDEVLAAISFPRSTGAGTVFGYYKFKFSESSWPIVTAACSALPDGSLRVSVGGLYTRPIVFSVENPSAGAGDRGWRADVQTQLDGVSLEPHSDVLAAAPYRKKIAASIVARAVKRAVEADLSVPRP